MPSDRLRTSVSLVIPARNAERTLESCLNAVVPLLETSLREIIVVDDNSTDTTAKIARRFPVVCLASRARGAGAARNAGWRAAKGDLVWFIDADCVVDSQALERLLASISASSVWAAGGSYSGAMQSTLLSALIQEEIAERHRAMPLSVDFLASFHVLYRRDALEKLGGFDEQFLLGQDIDLAYRLKRSGGEIVFSGGSTVRHFHPTSVVPYLRKQARHGYWRIRLYSRHPERIPGDSYSSLADHLQPVFALASVFALAAAPSVGVLPAALFVVASLLFAAPMALRLFPRVGVRGLWYFPFTLSRSYARAVGAFAGLCALTHSARLFESPPVWTLGEEVSG